MLKKTWIGLTILAQAIFMGGIPLAVRAESTPIISAVQTTGGTGQTSNDFIELYNPSDQAFNLNGYRLVKRTATGTADSSIKSWTSDTLIPAHSFYLWANSAFTTITSVPDLTSTATLSDNNGVALRQGAADTGAIIDSFSWGTAANGFPVVSTINPGANESLARVDLFDASLGYQIHASNPRNSTVQVLPPNAPPPTPPPSLVDNALCANNNQVIDANTSQTIAATVSFTNNGTTTWDSNYQLSDNLSNNYLLPSSVAPNASTDFNVNLTAPAAAGQVSYLFKMQNGTTSFGEICSLTLNVTAPSVTPPPPPTPTTIRINELLPNPTGDDSGQEKIELFNYGTETVDLSNWVLDDIAATDPLSLNAYTLGALTVPPQAYAVITLPAGGFSMNNTGGEVITLFDTAGADISTAAYETAAPENQSFSYFSDGWQWTDPTIGTENIKPVVTPPPVEPPPIVPPDPDPIATVSINEVYSFPKPGQTEFLELYNFGTTAISLKDITLEIGDKHKLLPDIAVAPGHYVVIQDKNLPSALRNTGQTLKLTDSQNRLIDSLAFPKADRGQAYAKFEDGFLWTLAPTPGETNQLVIPEDKKSKLAAVTSTISNPPTVKKTSIAKPKSTALAAAVLASADPASGDEPYVALAQPVNTPTKKKWPAIAILIAGIGTVGAGMWMSYYYGFKEQPDFV